MAADGTRRRVPGTYEWAAVGLPYVIVYEIDEAAAVVAIIAVFMARKTAIKADGRNGSATRSASTCGAAR